MLEKYYTLDELFEMVNEPNRQCCKKIYLDNKEMFEKARGSKTKHQAWEGGYLDHLIDSMNIAVKLYSVLKVCRKFQFTLSDSLLVIYLHDLEKAWKYGGTIEEQEEVKRFSDYQDFIKNKILEYNFKLTNEHWNGLKYVHGEGKDYDPFKNIQLPLAAFVGACDNFSARIWFDEPKKKNSW